MGAENKVFQGQFLASNTHDDIIETGGLRLASVRHTSGGRSRGGMMNKSRSELVVFIGHRDSSCCI